MRARVKQTTTWISKSKTEIENEEEILACRRIILKIVRYMKDNKMNQKDLAEKLNVPSSTIQFHIEKLKSEGRIERVGGARGGHWEVH